jgi:hypothetical protein
MQRFTPLEYIKIDIANSFGLDKLDWNDRIDWFDKNQNSIAELIHQAKEPALFYAGCKAYNAAIAGQPTGYMISLDATSSGLQLLAALTGDRLASQLCNVVSTGKREDAYTKIYQVMLNQLGETAKISRDDCKDAIMTALYSSKAQPKRIFGEGALLDLFYDTMITSAPGAWELNEAMLGLWNSNADSHDWVLPDNFHVQIKVMDSVKESVNFLNQPFDCFYKVNQPIEQGRSLGANTIHSVDGMVVREMTRRCDYDINRVNYLYNLLSEDSLPYGQETKSEDDKLVITLWNHYQNSGYLSARIIQHLNADNLSHVNAKDIWLLLESLPEKPFKVISIHDCFRCHPNYGNDLRKQYANQLMLIAKSEMLSYLVSQLVGRSVTVGKLDPHLWQSIQNTDYALS